MSNLRKVYQLNFCLTEVRTIIKTDKEICLGGVGEGLII